MNHHLTLVFIRAFFAPDHISLLFGGDFELLILFEHKNLRLSESSGEDRSLEFIAAAQFFEAHESVDCFTFDEHHHSRKSLNLELLDNERRFLHIDRQELTLRVGVCHLGHVVVQDLASVEILVVEVANHKLFGCCVQKELLLVDLDVFT